MRIVSLCVACCLAAPVGAQDYRDLVPDTNRFKAYEYGLPAGVKPKGRVIRFSQIDRNHNHVWEPYEIRRAFGPAAYDAVLSFDANADGHVTLLEFRAFDDNRTGGPDGKLWERVRG